jgi:hypothetical protein
MGSPPPAGLKKELLKLRSVNNIVIPAANTGNDNNNNTAVTNTAQINKGIKFIFIPGTLILITVAMKFIAPIRDDIPAKCKENMQSQLHHPTRLHLMADKLFILFRLLLLPY